MKGFIAALLAAALSCFPVHATELELYRPDGEKIIVESDDAELMRLEGWYYYNEVFTTVFSGDGRQAAALMSQLDEWRAVGWYDSADLVQTTLYSEDGREITVWNSEVEAYLNVGWFRTPDEVRTTLYSEDGREITVWNSEVEAYLNVGWFRTPDEVRTTLYSEDGREITVWNSEVEAYLNVGWFRTPDEVRTTLYSEDGREITVWNSEVLAYLAVGWFKSLGEVRTTLYSEDGRKITVWNSEVEDYLKVGWFKTPDEAMGNQPMVALTFDDGPGPYTDKILACLSRYSAKATFFVVGNRLDRYSQQLISEVNLGMEIGCHSWSHPSLTGLGSAAISSQIFDTNNKVMEIAGVYPSTLRPPYGSHNATVRSVAKAPIILWSIDTLDWKTRNADSTYNAVINNVRDGDIILMHDIHAATADAVERIVPALIEKGYKLVTVSELGKRKGGLSAGQVYSNVRP